MEQQTTQANQIQIIQASIQSRQAQLLHHPTYSKIKSIDDLRIFMEHHIYAVWDFMSLLKALQRNLTCVNIPWQPKGDATIRHFINEIVLGEECDINWEGQMQSHYEMYLEAMQLAGANTTEMEGFIESLNGFNSVHEAINTLPNSAIRNFLNFTFDLISEGKDHKIAAAFTFGREDLIPGMFTGIVEGLRVQQANSGLAAFEYYLKRHIELDGDEHGPLALKLIDNLCNDQPHKWEEVEATAQKALDLRIALWDSIGEQI